MERKHRDVGVLWCANRRTGRSNGWSFPPEIDRHLRKMTENKHVCHLFGGLAQFGRRCDIDPAVQPDVISDAWLPPFRRDAFDVVILDPPYLNFSHQTNQQLLRASAYIARESVIWFHTMWIAGNRGLQLRRSWLVRVGDSSRVRCIQEFAVRDGEKHPAALHFTRGPAVKYNRWLGGNVPLPFGPREATVPQVRGSRA